MGDKFLAIALSPDGRTLATDVGAINGAERSETLTLRDASGGRVIRTIKILGQNTSLAPIGSDLSAQSKSADGAPLPPFTRHLRAVRFTTDGRVAVAFNDSQSVISDGRQRFTGRENKIRIWDASSGREMISLDAGAQSSGALDQISQYGAPYHFAFSNDNRLCAVVSGKTIRLFDPVAGRILAMIIGRNDGAAVSFSADGKFLATTGFDSAIKIWDVSAAPTARVVTQERTLGRTALPVESAAFSGDGRSLAVGGANAGDVWDLNAGVALPTIAMPTVIRGVDKPSAIALNNDGGLIASAVGGRWIKIKEARSGRELFTLTQERSVYVYSLAWSADGRLIASSQLETRAGMNPTRLDELENSAEFYDHSIILWDAAEGRELRRISGHTSNILATAFSPDSRLLASVGDDAVVKLWDTATGRELAALKTKANILLALKLLSLPQATLPAGAPSALSKIQPAQPEDAVSIFFAGHGAAQGARFYLIPHDLGYAGARNAPDAEGMRTILSHGVSDLELEAALEGVDAGQMLFVLDACDSGQALQAEEKRRGPMNSSGLAQPAYEKGMYILTAAQSYQAAIEAAQLGHGYLTSALIEDGLKKGLADRDPKDGLALASEWFNYAEERVPQMQEREMQTRPPLDFAGDDAKGKDPKQRGIQRPRAFYRRELETRQFVVAKP